MSGVTLSSGYRAVTAGFAPVSRSRAGAPLGLILCLGVVAATAGPACGQAVSAVAPPLDVIKRPLVAWMTSRKHIAPDTLEQFTTSNKRTARFRALMEALADQDWAEVDALSEQISYKAAALREQRTWFAIAYDRRGRDPTVIVNLKPRLSACADSAIT